MEVTWIYYSMFAVRGPQLDKDYNMNTVKSSDDLTIIFWSGVGWQTNKKILDSHDKIVYLGKKKIYIVKL